MVDVGEKIAPASKCVSMLCLFQVNGQDPNQWLKLAMFPSLSRIGELQLINPKMHDECRTWLDGKPERRTDR